MDNAKRDPKVLEVYLHVQTRYHITTIFEYHSLFLICSNEEARQFYLSHGFEQTGMIENYYKRIEPPHCYVLRKAVRGADDAPDAESKPEA
jgi:N-alpha-acetyltransferase 50